MNFVRKHYIYFIPFLYLIVAKIAGYNGLYGQDGHEYLRFSKALSLFFTEGSPPGDFYWPLIYPLLAVFPGFVLGSAFSLQLLSILSFSLIIYFTDKIIEAVYGVRTGKNWYLLIVIACCPFVFRLGISVMSDVMATAFTTAVFLFLIKIEKGGNLMKNTLAAVIFSGLAVMTRYAAGIVLIFPVMYIAWKVLQSKAWKVVLAGICISPFAFIPHLLLRQQDPTGFIKHEWLSLWSPFHIFSNSFNNLEHGAYDYSLPNIVYALAGFWHPGLLFFGILLTFFLLRAKKNETLSIRIILMSILAYSIFLAGIPYQNTRFLILVFPLIAVLLYPGWEKVNFHKFTPPVLLAIQLLLCVYAFRTVYSRQQLEKNIAAGLLEYPSNKKIYSFDIDIALPSYGVENELLNLWEKNYDNYEQGALVLFNEMAFATQWEGRNPMLNWEKMNSRHKLKELKQYKKGWVLYLIE